MKKKNIIVVMLILVAVMAIGYGAFSTTLTINGTANISSSWEVVFTEIKQLSKTSGVSIKTAPSASGTTATFDVDLTTPGDYIEYQITVENKGSIDAKIESITATETGSDAIIFEITNIKEGQTLLKQATKTFNVKISYKDSITSQPNIVLNKLMVSINFVQLVGSATEGDAPSIVTEKLAARILKDNVAYADNVRSPYVNSDSGIDFSQVSSAENGQGLYYTNKNTEGGKTTYYFRGNVENNYVQLGEESMMVSESGVCIGKGYEHTYLEFGFSVDNITTKENCEAITYACLVEWSSYVTDEASCIQYTSDGLDVQQVELEWFSERVSSLFRIIRINEDGSVRLMWTTPSEVDACYASNYATDGMKSDVDRIYEKYLTGLASYLVDSGFCNDNSFGYTYTYRDDWDGDGNVDRVFESDYYGYTQRTTEPQFACPREIDLYTLPDSSKGNGKLTYAVGLMTADEANYTRWSWYTTPYNNLTMTPITNSLSGEGPPAIYTTNLKEAMMDCPKGYLYPVINVKGDITVLRGNGTSDSPYVLDLN